MKKEELKKNRGSNQNFVVWSLVIGAILSLCFSYLLEKFKLAQGFPNFYFLIFLVISILGTVYYSQKHKEDIKKGFGTVFLYILTLMLIGIFALISGPIFFLKNASAGYGYDFIFLGVFCIFVTFFLKKEKSKLEKQGILLLFKTQFGVQWIDKFAKKHQKMLRVGQYVVIISGYILMVSMIWLLIKTTHLYLTTTISQYVKAPPVAPLIPYFPEIFGLESFFPPLYFTYFIIALTVVAVFHEAAHGIFARYYGFKVHSTGFVFLGPILGAFVEPDEKQMGKADKKKQLAVLSAGTFANVLMFVIFGLIMLVFFWGLFTPLGLQFNSYALSEVNVGEVNVIGPSSIGENLILIEVGGARYFARQENIDAAKENEIEKIVVIDDSPAFRAQMGLGEAIAEIDGEKILSYDDLRRILENKSPGETIEIKTAVVQSSRGTISEMKSYDIELGEKNGKAFLGVGFLPPNERGTVGFLMKNTISKIKKPLIFYESKWGEFGYFIYYLLWWIVVINILVALFNMLPLGILDGGRFFYLTIWGITGSEKIGRNAYKAITWIIALAFVVMMIKWAIGIF